MINPRYLIYEIPPLIPTIIIILFTFYFTLYQELFMISVLYVDDDLTLLELGKLFLERTGEFQVELRDSAVEAVELLKNTSF
jgi:hypothetical protein